MSQQLITSNEISPTSGVANTGIVGLLQSGQIGSVSNTSIVGTLNISNGGTGLSTVGTNGQVLTSNGTTLSWVTPTAVTPGGSNTQIQFNNAGAFGGSANLTWDGTNVFLNNAGAARLGWNNAGNYYNWIESAGGVGTGYMRFATVNTEFMRLDSSGNLLIGGTTSPSGKSGNLVIETSSGGLWWQSASTAYMGTLDANPLVIYTNNAERMRIDSAGNVGIGTSSPTTFQGLVAIAKTSAAAESVPLSLVNVSGSTGTSVSLGFAPNINIDLVRLNAYRTDTGYGGATDLLFKFWDGSNITEKMRVTNVGVIKNASGRPMLNQTGGILQVVQTVWTGTQSTTGTNSWVNITGLTASITPSSTSSKIMVIVNIGRAGGGTGTVSTAFRLTRGGTPIGVGAPTGSQIAASFMNVMWQSDTNHSQGGLTINYVDSPASASSVTYSVDWYIQNTFQWYINRNASGGNSTDSYNAYVPSIITLMEIAG